VQLMFTVPRERLRVVNADVDGRSIISAEEAVAATTEEEQQDSDANWERLWFQHSFGGVIYFGNGRFMDSAYQEVYPTRSSMLE